MVHAMLKQIDSTGHGAAPQVHPAPSQAKEGPVGNTFRVGPAAISQVTPDNILVVLMHSVR
jgi:hypothetical protein